MKDTSLLIKTLKYDIRLDEQRDFDTLSKVLSKITNRILIETLQKTVNELFLPQHSLYYNRIVIDIGEIKLDTIEVLEKQILEQIVTQLKKILTSQVPEDKRTNDHLILFYLHNGFFPWWAHSKTSFNDYLSSHIYEGNNTQKLLHFISSSEAKFHRLFNVLNEKNRDILFERLFLNRFSIYVKLVSLFGEVLKQMNIPTSSRNKIQLHYYLFKFLLKPNVDNKESFTILTEQLGNALRFQGYKLQESIEGNLVTKRKFELVFNSKKPGGVTHFLNERSYNALENYLIIRIPRCSASEVLEESLKTDGFHKWLKLSSA